MGMGDGVRGRGRGRGRKGEVSAESYHFSLNGAGAASWSAPASTRTIRSAIIAPATPAFLNWFPEVPIAMKYPGIDDLS